MSHRTRKTKSGLKSRLNRRRRGSQHGPIKRIVGDTPMVPLREIVRQRLREDAALEWLAGEFVRTGDLVALIAVGVEEDRSEEEQRNVTVCLLCSMRAMLAEEPTPLFEETPEQHLVRVHPDFEATVVERADVEKKLLAKLTAKQRQETT